MVFLCVNANLFILWVIRNPLNQLASAMPQAVTVTPEEREAIERVSLKMFCALLVYCCVTGVVCVKITVTGMRPLFRVLSALSPLSHQHTGGKQRKRLYMSA